MRSYYPTIDDEEIECLLIRAQEDGALCGRAIRTADDWSSYPIRGHAGSDAAEPLYALGVLAVALGIGFMLSSIVAYVMSRRMGLIEDRAGSTSSGMQT